MSDTGSSYSDEYKVDTWEALEKAKQQVMSNYMCKCCNIVFCEECLITNARLKLCSKSIPLDIINAISSNIRCGKCLKMIEAIEKQYTREDYFNHFGAPLELFIVKLLYYKTLNEFPDYDVLQRELFNDNERFNERRYRELIYLWNRLGSYAELYEFKDTTLEHYHDEYVYQNTYLETQRFKEDPYEELHLLFNEFMKILSYIDEHEQVRSNILYGECFGMEITEDLNNLFFDSENESESEYDSDEED